MYSRRKVLKGFFLLIPALFSPTWLVNSIYNVSSNKRNGKFVKKGWVLQEGDI